MPAVTIKYLASFQVLIGKEGERYPISSSESLESLKTKLTLKYGGSFKRQIDSNRAIVFLNGKMISGNTDLNEHDEIVFAMVVGGG